MIPGIAPLIVTNAAGDLVVTMVAGRINANLTGYDNAGPTGSISAEPLPGFVLGSIVRSTVAGSGTFRLWGNAVSAMTGKSVWINGTPHSLSGLTYYPAGDYSLTNTISPAFPFFVVNQAYTLEIK